MASFVHDGTEGALQSVSGQVLVFCYIPVITD